MKDYYAILGVEKQVDEAGIRLAYSGFLQGVLPPGKSMGDVDEAFAVLKDPVKRKAYDSARVMLEKSPQKFEIPETPVEEPAPRAAPETQIPRPTSRPSPPPTYIPEPPRGVNEHLYGKPETSSSWAKALHYGMGLLGIGSMVSTVMGYIIGAGTLVLVVVVAGVVYWMWPQPAAHNYVPVAHERPIPFHAQPFVRPPAQSQAPRLQMASAYANVQRLMQEAFSDNKEMRELAVAQIESRPNSRLGDHTQSSDLLEKGRRSASRNDDRSAVEALSRAVRVDPTNIDAWEFLMQIEARNSQYQEAEKVAISALALYPRSERLWTAVSSVFEKEGRRDLATTALANSVLLSNDPSSAATKLRTDTQTLSSYGLQNVAQAALAKPSIKALLGPDSGGSLPSPAPPMNHV